MQNNQHHIQHRGDALFDDALGPQVEDGMLSSNENLKDRSYRNELKDRYIDQEQIDVAVIKPSCICSDYFGYETNEFLFMCKCQLRFDMNGTPVFPEDKTHQNQKGHIRLYGYCSSAIRDHKSSQDSENALTTWKDKLALSLLIGTSETSYEGTHRGPGNQGSYIGEHASLEKYVGLINDESLPEKTRQEFKNVKTHIDKMSLDSGGLTGVYTKLLKFAKPNKYNNINEIHDPEVRMAVIEAQKSVDKAFFPWVGHLAPFTSLKKTADKYMKKFDSNAGFRYNRTRYKEKRQDDGKTKFVLTKGDCYDDLVKDAEDLARHWKKCTEPLPSFQKMRKKNECKKNDSDFEDYDKIPVEELPVTDIYFTAKQSNNKHAFDKIETDTKTRLVFAPDGHYMLTAQLVFRPIQNEFDARPWQPLGSGIPGEDGAKYRYNFMNTNNRKNEFDEDMVAMLDYKGYDASVDAWIIKMQYQSVKGYFQYQDKKEENEYHNLIDALCREFIYSKYVMPDGFVFEKSRGVTSGAFETTYMNSRINYFYIQFGGFLQEIRRSGLTIQKPLNTKHRHTKILSVVVYGDDCLCKVRNFDFVQYGIDVKHYFNAEVHQSPKTVINKPGNFEGLKFCGYEVRKDEKTGIVQTFRNRHEWFEKIIMVQKVPSYQKADQKERIKHHQELNLFTIDDNNNEFCHPWSTQRQLESFKDIGAYKDPLFKLFYDKFFELYLDTLCFHPD